MFLFNFHSIRPPYESTQEQTLLWIAAAHQKAEEAKGLTPEDSQLFAQSLYAKLLHVGCKPSHIHKRGHVLKDFCHQVWAKMDIYNLDKLESGKNLTDRARFFEDFVDEIFKEYYPQGSSPPHQLIHVSCTGYVAPSGAQKIVSKNHWGQSTTVTHAYHMGCYGAIAALRIGSGFASHETIKVDIVHTELCGLHFNPSLHGLDQLVVQSLFADGFMKYSLSSAHHSKGFKIHTVLEEIIPNSTHAMGWNLSEWGFQMRLAKDTPVLILNSIQGYLERLTKKGNLPLESLLKTALFAIHPGGPKILSFIQKQLSLEDHQIQHSVETLQNYGNMSSATLPHVWEKILNDPCVKHQTPIISLAFGPGLTVAGAIMEKQCGS